MYVLQHCNIAWSMHVVGVYVCRWSTAAAGIYESLLICMHERGAAVVVSPTRQSECMFLHPPLATYIQASKQPLNKIPSQDQINKLAQSTGSE